MSDYIVRATAADGQIRAFAATTREMAEEGRRRHGTSPVATAALGRLMTAGAMMGSMLKGEKDMLTLQIKGSGPIGSITVTADAAANVKGYVQEPGVMLPANAAGKLDVSGAIGEGMLTVIKDMGLKEPYSGQTVLQTGEIAEDLTYYFATSEQVPSAVGLGVLMEKDNTVKQAGGFIIQLMPFASDDIVDKLEEKIGRMQSVTAMFEAGMTPEQLLLELLGEFGLDILQTVPTGFYCNCDKKRVEKAIISIGKKDIREMIHDGKSIEVMCHFCNTPYTFSVEELMEIEKRAMK